ncbi:MAG: glycosyltransferase [Chitinophagales bacterium]|nr:glycosyltransferase [Chitinophagales bacterium]
MSPSKPLHIVIWAFPSWKGDYLKSTVELAKELAVNNKVLYIDYAHTIKDRVQGKSNAVNPSLRKERLANGASIHILTLPAIIPFNWTNSQAIYELIESVNFQIIQHTVRKATDALGFQQAIIINAFNPFFHKAAKKLFPNQPYLYYCYDNIDVATWAKKHGSRLEQQTMNEADAVVFSSQALKTHKQYNIPAYVVNNGVDLRNFQQVTTPPNKDKVIVGYVGSVDDRLDYDLLTYIISNHPQWEFQFIGRIMCQAAWELERYRNVRLLGAKPAHELPGLMAQFSVGIIPFIRNEFTSNIYPMKVNEYLAIGLPVVMTDFAVLADLNELVMIATDKATFENAIDNALLQNDEETMALRKAKAYKNSWENKAMELEQIIREYV